MRKLIFICLLSGLASCTPYQYFGTNNANFPKKRGKEIILIPDNQLSAGAAVWLKKSYQPPFSIEFEYSIWDDDGGTDAQWNSADGISVMFCKDAGAYGKPPTGQERGFLNDGTGYGIHIMSYGYDRGIVLTSASGSRLDEYPENNTYTHGDWCPMRIEVRETSVKVYYRDNLAIFWQGKLDGRYGGVGFGSGTGGADGEHKIRSVRVKSLLE